MRLYPQYCTKTQLGYKKYNEINNVLKKFCKKYNYPLHKISGYQSFGNKINQVCIYIHASAYIYVFPFFV